MAFSVPASASIVISQGATGTGNNVLFQNVLGEGTTSLSTDTNLGDRVTFTSNEALTVPASGAARISAVDGSLNNLEWHLSDPTLGYDLGVFNINVPNQNGGPATSVTVYAYDQNNTEFSNTFNLGNGQNFFTVDSDDLQSITSIRFEAFGGIVDDVRQVRIDGITSIAAVPEPSTWAMMILGFFAIGAMTYRQRKNIALRAA
ncbi:PEPxxWA-CTERM sorting domain-containing protein [Nitrobacter sp. Nb-311A]|uniref:PEPxxWA-CTERM sorting domain-containing protein n=1 Tax=Nitrobacter sp. Nb-311A TaxID=314253 RepID=UPI0003218228|nr:PEPxxWA-CTERM sorting domain-containing protein [Nitrobacter sp. Nb-311A]